MGKCIPIPFKIKRYPFGFKLRFTSSSFFPNCRYFDNPFSSKEGFYFNFHSHLKTLFAFDIATVSNGPAFDDEVVRKSFRFLYSPSPEYSSACRRDEWQGEPRRSSSERRRVGYGAIPLSFIQGTPHPPICAHGGGGMKRGGMTYDIGFRSS